MAWKRVVLRASHTHTAFQCESPPPLLLLKDTCIKHSSCPNRFPFTPGWNDTTRNKLCLPSRHTTHWQGWNPQPLHQQKLLKLGIDNMVNFQLKWHIPVQDFVKIPTEHKLSLWSKAQAAITVLKKTPSVIDSCLVEDLPLHPIWIQSSSHHGWHST